MPAITDDELTAQALAADPDAPVPDDAVVFTTGAIDADQHELLPAWYMPAPMARGGGRARRLVIVGLIGSLLLVNGAGLCVTYGFPEIAW
ncbi:MAG: hypothetical protein ABW328_04070 [Ilumatobacteraceae bacterium]